jgi:pilus assembly protein Flp/PilA
MRGFLRALWRDESGQGLVEYALIIALVAIAVIAALVLLGNRIGNIFNDIGEQLDQYTPGGGTSGGGQGGQGNGGGGGGG